MLSESIFIASSYNEALQLGTYIQEDISLSAVNDVYSPNSPEGAINFLDLPVNRSYYSGMPYLNLIVQPAEMYRFRYESEKGSHGGLGGKGTSSKKSCPTIKLENYKHKRNVVIRVSLYTKEENPRPHVLQLKKKNSVTDDAVYEKLGKDFTAKFQSLCIVNKKKEEIVEILKNRKLKELYSLGFETRKLDKKHEREIEETAKSMQGCLNAVKLCFEAFYENDLSTPICEKIFSDPVYNQKSSVAGELKIHRLSRVSGSCRGGDEIILLCDKVRKEDIRVRFYEIDEHDNEVWTDQGTFNLADVHYQVAITFKTPPYKSNVEKEVKIQLYRTTDGSVSESRDFKYLPDEEDFENVARKRKKPNPSHNFPANTQISVPGSKIANIFGNCSSDGNAEAPSGLSAKSSIKPANEAMQVSYSLHLSGEDSDSNSLQDTEDLNDFLTQCIPKISAELVDAESLLDPACFDDLNIASIDNSDTDYLDIDGAVAKVASLSLNDDNRSVFNWKPESTHKKCLRELIACILQCEDVNSLLHSVQNIIPQQDDYGNSLLHIAVSSQNVNLKIMRHLLSVLSEDVVNLKNKQKETALHLAVKQNKERVLKLLLEKGGDLSIPNEDGNNCLHIAAKSDFVLCMEELLRTTKCSYFHALNAHNYEGVSPLHFAVMNKSLKCMDLLLQAGAYVNIIEKKGGQTPLHMAVETQISVIQRLLKEPEIDVNAEDFRGITPLQLAYIKVNGVQDEGNMDRINKYPAEDLSKGLEILKVLTGQTNEELMNTEDNKNVIERNQSVDSWKEKELCHLLDTNLNWRKLGEVLGMDEGMLQNMQKCCSQPTKMLLAYMKRKYDNYSDTLMQNLCIAELKDAIEILNRSSDIRN